LQNVLTILDGSHFLVVDDCGNASTAAEGLFACDTRHVSLWRLTFDDRVPRVLGAGTSDHATATAYLSHDSGTPSHPTPIAAIRRQCVAGDTFQERLRLENDGAEPAEVVVRYAFDADFLDLFEVKASSFQERDLAFAKTISPLHTSRWYDDGERVFAFAVTGDFDASTFVRFDRPGIAGDREMHFVVPLEPRSTWTLSIDVAVVAGERSSGWRYVASEFTAARERLDASLEGWRTTAPKLTGELDVIGPTYRRSLDDLGALRMPSGDAGDGPALLAAGLPWFMTLFGRDTLLTSFQTLPLGDGLARAALRRLGELQADADDPRRDAEPGKVLHEVRRGKVAALTRQFPYYGSADSTPLYLILLSEVWRWSGDDAFVAELEAPARRALDWLERFADLDGDGFVEFERRAPNGIEIQCWRDSWDSMRYQDGTIARAPLAVADVQAYAYAARIRTAELARRVWRDEPLAARLEADAARLRDRFDEAFWVERDGIGYYALALDADKRPVDALSSSTGHVLFTDIVPEGRLPELARVLVSDRLFSGFALRTLAVDGDGYNPIGYHTGTAWPHDTSIACYGLARHGFGPEALRLGMALSETAAHFGWRLPEAIAGYGRADTGFPVPYPTACAPQAWAAGAPILCLRAMLGLEPDPERRALDVDPVLLPQSRARLRWEGVSAFGRRWLVDVEGDEGRVEPLD
jgi:glycogen debranching enzyme